MKKIYLLILLVTAVFACKKDDQLQILPLIMQSTANSIAFKLPDSGQNGCWDAAGTFISCTGTAQDGEFSNLPAPLDYKISDGGYTVTESSSRLIWQRCLKGQSGINCDGTGTVADNFGADPGKSTQSEARAYCSSLRLAGRTWRLPSAREFSLLSNYQYRSPAFDDNDAKNYFPSHPQGVSGNFETWSSTPAVEAGTGFYWNFYAQHGAILEHDQSMLSYVRCVSGEAVPAPRFTDNGDGTITDGTTRLLWMKCSLGGTGTTGNPLDTAGGGCTLPGSDTRVWNNALAACKNLTYAGRSDWRLPSVRELTSIVDYSAPAGESKINANFFPNTRSYYYHTSTTSLYWLSVQWSVYFLKGETWVVGSKAGNNFYTRCVTDVL